MRTRSTAHWLLKATAAAGVALVFALLTASSARAVDLPELTVSPYIDVSDGFEPTTITVSGTDCVAKPGMPASVTLTVDNIDGVFTATPADDGTWSIDVLIDTEDAGAISAACDNYLGSNSYPEGWVGFVAVLPAEGSAGGGTSTGGENLANTGPHAARDATVALGFIGAGATLVWAGRRRSA